MKSLVIGLAIGIAIAYLGVYFTGFSAAIAVPQELTKVLSGKIFLIWEIAVTQFLGYGVIAFLLVFFSIKILQLSPWVTAIASLFSCEALLFATYTSQYTIYFPHFIVLVGCGTLAAFMASRKKHAQQAQAKCTP
ncbi:hypothetical protein Mag101_04880 [Microbulbifer agarilyticus]|uniref:Uncharacterized protein n=1 Tax=Microbulbifer agarilyticus TaxID=260552 RepID=A0A1Q2M3C6_9GAMM|nr:hypothetical protein [Microbulbifer agarilyticus]AQQ67048.1 hypothetical protein Mag101_04880 [Microbulbifer agarilyticus]